MYHVESCWGCYQVVHTESGQLMATVEINLIRHGEYDQCESEEDKAQSVANHIRMALDEMSLFES